MAFYNYHQHKIKFSDEGNGPALVLIHGYLETLEVWDKLVPLLTNHFRVIRFDIPGHGESEMLDQTHSMSLMAETTNALLDHLQIESCTMVGHSMGGYVTLAFAELHPEKLKGFSLFHSSVFADNQEKKIARAHEIALLEKGKQDEVTQNHLPKTFANQNLNRFSTELAAIKQAAKKHTPQGISALIRGMMERPDQQQMVQSFQKPMLFLFGRYDNFIKPEAAGQMALLNPAIQIGWLENSGHMGMIEEPERSVEIIVRFVEFCNGVK